MTPSVDLFNAWGNEVFFPLFKDCLNPSEKMTPSVEILDFFNACSNNAY